MTKTVRMALAAAVLAALPPVFAAAQTFEGPGARAQGMGAFVAVADDASAVYWNPAGLAAGAYFSLLLDRTAAEAGADADDRAGGRSSWLVALSTPALGLSYYRLASTIVTGDPSRPAGASSRVESLVTHHGGATLVHSITERLAVGTTVKLVRGIATVGEAAARPSDLLDDWELLGIATNRFDADVGVMLTGRALRAGLTVRNLFEPKFHTGTADPLRLDRQARAGVSVLLTESWTAAADFDLTRNRGPFGDLRMVAIGAEGRIARRALARGGFQFNTAGPDGRQPLATLGASYAVLGTLLVDAHFSTGADHAFTGWGLAGRVTF